MTSNSAVLYRVSPSCSDADDADVLIRVVLEQIAMYDPITHIGSYGGLAQYTGTRYNMVRKRVLAQSSDS